MSNDITDLVQSAITGGARGFLGEFAVRGIDEARFIQMFVEAGEMVAGYEYYKTEENDFRARIFDKENMVALAKMMRSIDDFSWMDALEKELDHKLEGLEKNNRENCKRHFMEIIETSIMRNRPDKYGHVLLADTHTAVLGLRGEVQTLSLEMQRLLDDRQREQEDYLYARQEQSDNRESYIEREENKKESRFYIPRWNLTYQNVHWEHGMNPEEREADIRKLTEAWSRERLAYPNWYIPPCEVCIELANKTSEVGLLQCHTAIDIDTMFAFCYELVWRYEKSMSGYLDYEMRNIYQIWDSYGKRFAAWNKEDFPAEQEEAVTQWFDVGMALLREYRECGMDAEWDTVYEALKSHAKLRWHGEQILQVERAKQALYHMDIPATRRYLSHCRLDKTDYELRLQTLSIRVELDEAEAVVEEFQRMIPEIRQAGVEQPENYLYYASLQACALQLYALCAQGVWNRMGVYEAKQRTINQIEDEIERYKEVFDWTAWRNRTTEDLLRWHVNKYEEKEAFELNREIHTLGFGSSGCMSAYRFYRLLDRLALPLRCQYVTLLGEWEHPWIEAVLELNNALGVFLLCKTSRSKIIETLMDREYLSALSNEEAKRIVSRLIHAFSGNMDEIEDRENMSGGMIAQILENVPNLLVRFMSRCPEENQGEALLMLKSLLEKESLPVSFQMALLCVEITRQVSERIKAQMLDTMLQTAIVEHKTMHGHGEGMDLFACYFDKTELGPLKALCEVRPETTAKLLEIPQEYGYVWQTKVLRLEILDSMGLLNEEQRQGYAKLIWSFVGENGLPRLSNMHVFAFEKMPCTDVYIPARSVKGWFLSQSVAAQFEKERGCSLSLQKIPYLDELILVCDNMNAGYWSGEEADRLLAGILDYWDILKTKMSRSMSDSVIWDEYSYRARRMLQCMAAIVRNTGSVSEERSESLRRMIAEMQALELSTKELEVELGDSEKLAKQMIVEMRSADRQLTIGALMAAFHYMMAHPEQAYAQKLLDEILNLLSYGKMPGLISAAWVLHNLFYAGCPILHGENLERVDECLLLLADMLHKNTENGLAFKDVLHMRKACVAIAFQMRQMVQTDSYEGVQRWKAVACDPKEINEVKNEWVW